jgi:hypothetical protein
MTCLGLGMQKANVKVAGKIRLAESYLPRRMRVQEPDYEQRLG